MIKVGKLIEYDNNIGIIKDINNIDHIVLKKDILCNDIKVNDIVNFTSEVFQTSEEDKNIARFVNKLSLKKQQK